LQQEGTTKQSFLAIEEVNEETIVFYEYNEAFGVASIIESNKGYSWFRNTVYTDFKGEIPYSTARFSFEIKTGLTIAILVGKAFDKSIQKIKLVEGNAEIELHFLKNQDCFSLFIQYLSLPLKLFQSMNFVKNK
jgi:hypothetical protein